MYRLLIADDEPLIARSIRQLILKTSAAFEVAEPVYDGQAALAAVAQNPPDVVFTDIRMPVMDGLTLAHRLHEDFPDVRTVILSGYDEFEYAKAAIREGVRAYLLKPLERDALAELLSQLEDELARDYHGRQCRVLSALVRREAPPAGLTLPEGPYLAAALHTAGALGRPGAAGCSPEALERFMHARAPGVPAWCVAGCAPGETLLLACCSEAERPALCELLGEEYKTLGADGPLTMLVQSLEPGELGARRLETLFWRLRRQRVFGASSLSMPGSETAEPAGPEFLDEETARTLAMLARENRFDLLRGQVDTLVDRLQRAGARQTAVEQTLRRLMSLTLCELQDAAAQNEIYRSLEDLLAECCDYASLRDGLHRLLADMAAARERTEREGLPQNQLIAGVRGWLDEHYCQPVTSAELARRFGIVPGYLGRLFRENTGCSIGHYVQELRLAKAEQLLRISPPLPLREIAETTGFSDQFYFSKVFKLTHGCTPAEYRTRQGLPADET